MKKRKLQWRDLITIFLWHEYASESVVGDDGAYVALLRVREFVEDSLRVLEGPATNTGSEEQ